MAKIKQGILGGFSGKVAGVVGTSWKGRAVMKSRPLSVANPKTEAQVEQRGKFSKIAELASKMLTTFVQPVENPISGDISGYNKFVKDNKGAFDAEGKLVAADFVCGGGKIVNLGSAQIHTDAAEEELRLNWSNSAETSALRKTDKVYVGVFDANGNLLAVSSGTETRNNTSVNFDDLYDAGLVEAGMKVLMLFACVSADGRDVSVMTNALEKTIS